VGAWPRPTQWGPADQGWWHSGSGSGSVSACGAARIEARVAPGLAAFRLVVQWGWGGRGCNAARVAACCAAAQAQEQELIGMGD
jgi:hypothetical protein